MKVWTWAAVTAAVIAVGGVAGVGIAAQQQLAQLEHSPAYELSSQAPLIEPATPEPVDKAQLQDAVGRLANNPALADFHARISDAATKEVIFDRQAAAPLRPASTTKILTAAAAILELGPRDTVTTSVYRGTGPGEVVIKAAGDVWMNAERLDELAAALTSSGAGQIQKVAIDLSQWDGMPELLPGWDPHDIDGGFVAPLKPAMLNGGRGLTEESGDVPRSHTPGLDVAQALADRLGAAEVSVAAVPADAELLASVQSPDLVSRLEVMMKNSDNVFAEAIGREVALSRGVTDAPAATLAVLAEHGYDLAATTIHDNSGLSDLNRITPLLLDSVLLDAATAEPLRPLLATLPVAAGDGTLVERYADLPGRGWVRAKTGTLDETSGLAGTVTSIRGNVYTFAFLSNGSSVLEARQALDELASVLREY